MSSSSNDTLATILKWAVVIVLGIVALKVIATLLNIAFFVGWVLLWRVVPLVIVIWVIYTVIEWLRGRNGGAGTQAPGTLDV
jgi:hypothetical protein